MLTRFEYRTLRNSSRLNLYVEYETRPQLDGVLMLLEREHIKASRLEITRSGCGYCAVLALQLPRDIDLTAVLSRVGNMPGVARSYPL